MSEHKASQQKQFCNISVAKFVSQSTQQDLKDNVGWDFDEVEGSSCAFIEAAMTISAAKHCIDEISGALQSGGAERLAMGTTHEALA